MIDTDKFLNSKKLLFLFFLTKKKTFFFFCLNLKIQISKSDKKDIKTKNE